MARQPAAVVFDLDGTLIDSVPDVRNALNTMLQSHGRRALSVDEVRLMVGEGAKVMLEKAFASTGGPCADHEAALAHYLDCYCANPVIDTTVYPGAMAALHRLSAAGIALGICTNKPERVTRLVLDALGLAPLMKAVIGGDTLPYRKPDGRHVNETLARMGVTSGAVVYVGDSETDVAAARSAGLPVIVVSFGYAGDEVRSLGADQVIDHFDQLDETIAEVLP